MTALVLVGLLGMLLAALVPTRGERARWRLHRDERRSLERHDRFVRDLRPTPVRRPHRPGGAR